MALIFKITDKQKCVYAAIYINAFSHSVPFKKIIDIVKLYTCKYKQAWLNSVLFHKAAVWIKERDRSPLGATKGSYDRG